MKLPDDRPFDGTDISAVLLRGATLPERPYFYYRGTRLFACRLGDYKAHFQTQGGYGPPALAAHEPPLLYNLALDASERFDIAPNHPTVLAAIKQAVAAHQATVTPVTSQTDRVE